MHLDICHVYIAFTMYMYIEKSERLVIWNGGVENYSVYFRLVPSISWAILVVEKARCVLVNLVMEQVHDQILVLQ